MYRTFVQAVSFVISRHTLFTPRQLESEEKQKELENYLSFFEWYGTAIYRQKGLISILIGWKSKLISPDEYQRESFFSSSKSNTSNDA